MENLKCTIWGVELTLLADQERGEGGIWRKDQSLMQGLTLLLLSTGEEYMDRKKGEGAEKFTRCAC